MNTVIRAFVLTLVVTGAIASTATLSNAKTTIAPRNSAMPTPACPPDDPNGCGIGQFSGR